MKAKFFIFGSNFSALNYSCDKIKCSLKYFMCYKGQDLNLPLLVKVFHLLLDLKMGEKGETLSNIKYWLAQKVPQSSMSMTL